MGKSSYPSHESKKESRMFSPVKGNEWGKRSCQPLDRSIGIGGKALNEKMRRLYPLGNHLTLFKKDCLPVPVEIFLFLHEGVKQPHSLWINLFNRGSLIHWLAIRARSLKAITKAARTLLKDGSRQARKKGIWGVDGKDVIDDT